MKLILLTLVQVAAVAVSARSVCKCTKELNPTCGSDGEWYDNPCEMRCNGVLTSAPRPSCGLKPIGRGRRDADISERSAGCPCTLDIRPTCGSDGKWYDNPCKMRCNGVLKTAPKASCGLKPIGRGRRDEGTTDSTTESTPGCVCTLELNEMCGDDGQTYPNLCALECADASLAYEGKCADRKRRDDDDEDSAVLIVPVTLPATLEPTTEAAVTLPATLEPTTTAAPEPTTTAAPEATTTEEENACNCPKNLYPLCGTDGETYDNPCMLQCADASLAYEGACADRKRRDDEGSAVLVVPVTLPATLEPTTEAAVTLPATLEPTTAAPDDVCLCPENLKYPVCGVNGETYDNPCLLQCADTDMAYEGECRSDLRKRDIELCACFMIYLPVCGKNGHTYSNECQMKCSNIEKEHDGDC